MKLLVFNISFMHHDKINNDRIYIDSYLYITFFSICINNEDFYCVYKQAITMFIHLWYFKIWYLPKIEKILCQKFNTYQNITRNLRLNCISFTVHSCIRNILQFWERYQFYLFSLHFMWYPHKPAFYSK